MFLGKKIKEARLQKGLTQKQLAEEIIKNGQKASNTTIANWESGLNNPDIDTLQAICNVLGKDGNYFFNIQPSFNIENTSSQKRLFPILGTVKAGYDYLAQENWIGFINIDKDVSDPDNYYALQVKGDSMQPVLYEDDIILVHRQNDIENGQIGIVLIDNEEATVKKIIKHQDYIELIAFNSYYPPKKLDNNCKFSIIGKVTEARISKIFE